MTKNEIFAILANWAWVFLIILAVVIVAIILNRDVMADIISSPNPRFRISENSKKFDKTFKNNQEVKRMIENGEKNFIKCSYCKHLKHCQKCSETDYDIADTVCGDYEL
ncbi:MAG: hypothetical protein IJY93_10260 [Clostridia bacterium]|nr:hypothetical protein [Clostridia bacterium]